MRLVNLSEMKNAVDTEKTLGVLKFSALRRERMERNEDGTTSDKIRERVYDLKCKVHGCMIQVGIPADVAEKKLAYDSEVKLVNPVFDTIATATYNGADVSWFIKADDIEPAKPQVTPKPPHGQNGGQ